MELVIVLHELMVCWHSWRNFNCWSGYYASNCFAAVNLTIQGLTRHKSDEMFEKFLVMVMVKHKDEDKCDPPVLPRK